MSARLLRVSLLAAAGLALVSSTIWFTYARFTSRYTGANDLYPRWVGTCALLREGLNPYSEKATLRIQQGIYGRAARPGEDQVAFAYPLYASLLVSPLCLTTNYPLVQAIWLWVSLGAVVIATALSIQTVGWRPSLATTALMLLWSILMYHSFRALVLGQLAVFVLLALALTLWAMRRGYDGWAGAFLALTMVKPQMVYLAVPWVLLWTAGKRRWRVGGGFAIASLLLVLVPMALVPSWVPDFLHQAFTYPSYTVYGSLTWIVVRHVLGLGRTAEIGFQVFLAAIALGLSWRFWRGSWEQMLWVLGVLLLLTNFFTPRIATTNYLALVPWVIWSLSVIRRSHRRRGLWAVLAIEAFTLIAPWLVFLTTIEGDFERAPAYLPFPAAVVALLIYLRPKAAGTANA